MPKFLVIALRDYLAAVKTKSFLVSLLAMPVIAFGSALISNLSRDVVDTSEKKIAIIDHTATPEAQAEAESRQPTTMQAVGEMMGVFDSRPYYQILNEAAQQRNEDIKGPSGQPTEAPYTIVPVDVTSFSTPQELAERRLELSDEVRSGELYAFIEIGAKILQLRDEDVTELSQLGMEQQQLDDDEPDFSSQPELSTAQQDKLDEFGIRYSAKNTADMSVNRWLARVLTTEVQERRVANAGVDPKVLLPLMRPPVAETRPLAVRASDGGVTYEPAPNMVVSLLKPFLLVFLLFALLATATFPLTTNIIEEKQLRIAEVLLGSVRPFELMLGKLFGGVGISLTLAAIYGAGGIYAAYQFGVGEYITVDLIVWFVVFATLATLMMGAISVAAGAAVTNLKEAQNIQMPITILPMLPMLVAINVVQNPAGPLASAITWFPLTTPMGAILRIGVRDGISLWEKFAAAGLSLVMVVILVWIAGRIFRFGMLQQDKAAALKDVFRWVARG